ncbi:MipA/OmpV family protein [Neogemmobacter tilapiae]|uniref:MltA-interacting MipA family protein n=1 Tax=Neogemmobacter tilapiae TaxID=875041 RepID=A0A918TXT7_9RHOB|nr:MipA/OmpV family protein [Gemmobacter tilapiae]GHC61443.1 MltA-interacting MipA family protein [Gemmobacter tilapiae]
MDRKATSALARGGWTFVFMLAGTPLMAQEAEKNWQFMAGIGGTYGPAYAGADDFKAGPLLDFSASYKDDHFFAGFRSGVGVTAFRTEKLKVQVALGYAFGRDEDDDPQLAGMGDIDGQLLGILRLDYDLDGFVLGAELKGGGDYGATLDLTAEREWEVTDRFALGIEAGTTLANADHQQTFFGITAAQSATSGHAAFATGGGLQSAGVGLTARYGLSPSTALIGGVRYDRLLGDAADSPLALDKAQPSAFAGLFIRF